MSDASNIPADMWGSLLRIEGNTARTEAKIDSLATQFSALTQRVDEVEKRLNEHDKKFAAREVMVDEYKDVKAKVDKLEDNFLETNGQKKGVSSFLKRTETLVGIIVALCTLLGWQVIDHPQAPKQTVQINTPAK